MESIFLSGIKLAVLHWEQIVARSLTETEMGSVVQFEHLGSTWNAFADDFITMLNLIASNCFPVLVIFNGDI